MTHFSYTLAVFQFYLSQDEAEFATHFTFIMSFWTIQEEKIALILLIWNWLENRMFCTRMEPDQNVSLQWIVEDYSSLLDYLIKPL